MSFMSAMLGSFSNQMAAHSSPKESGTRYREQDSQRWQEILDQAHSIAAADGTSQGQLDPNGSSVSDPRAATPPARSLTRLQPDAHPFMALHMAAAEPDAAAVAHSTSASALMATGPVPASPSSHGRTQLAGSLTGTSTAAGGARAWALHEQLLKAAHAETKQNAPLYARWMGEASQGWQLHLRAQGLDPSQAWTLAHVLRAGHVPAGAAPLTKLVCNGEVVYDHAAHPGTDTVFTG